MPSASAASVRKGTTCQSPFCRARLDRIDAHNLRAMALRFFDEVPQMQISDYGVRAPDTMKRLRPTSSGMMPSEMPLVATMPAYRAAAD